MLVIQNPAVCAEVRDGAHGRQPTVQIAIEGGVGIEVQGFRQPQGLLVERGLLSLEAGSRDLFHPRPVGQIALAAARVQADTMRSAQCAKQDPQFKL